MSESTGMYNTNNYLITVLILSLIIIDYAEERNHIFFGLHVATGEPKELVNEVPVVSTKVMDSVVDYQSVAAEFVCSSNL